MVLSAPLPVNGRDIKGCIADLCVPILNTAQPSRQAALAYEDRAYMPRFTNREEAGRELAAQLSKFQNQPIVMPVLNGGVPTAIPVARALNSSLLQVPMRSLHVPWQQETIFGYVTHHGELHLNQPLVGQVRLTPPEIQRMARKQRLALQMDLESWGVVLPDNLRDRTILLVDDGMHSGWTMFSAIETVKHMAAARIVAAVPVTHFRARRFVGRHCDEVVALLTEDIALYQIGNYYDDFPKLTSAHVKDVLKAVPAARPTAA
jgi:putative phosphoribosyl transferase